MFKTKVKTKYLLKGRKHGQINFKQVTSTLEWKRAKEKACELIISEKFEEINIERSELIKTFRSNNVIQKN